MFLRYLATTWRMGRPQRPAQLRCFAASPTATGCGFGSPVLGDKRAARLLFLMGCLRSYSIAISDDRNLPVHAPAEPHGVLPATHGHVCQCRGRQEEAMLYGIGLVVVGRAVAPPVRPSTQCFHWPHWKEHSPSATSFGPMFPG